MSLQAKNSSAENLITQHLDTWTQAIETKSTAGRGSSNKLNLVGIQKLRELILEMAVRGLLVLQDPNDKPASVLLEKIAAEKAQLIKDKKIKKTKALTEISEDEKPFDLPYGWGWARLPDVSHYRVGKTPATKNAAYWTEKDSGIPWVSIADLNHDSTVQHTNKKITDEAVSKVFKSEPAQKGSILMSFKLTVGKVSILETDAFHNEAIISINCFDGINDKYLFKVLPERANSGNSKRAIMGYTLNSSSLAELLIPVPPEDEQKRIVAKVDQLMALCDQLENQTLDSITTHQTLVETLLGNLVNPENTANFQDPWSLIAQNFDVLFTTEHSIDTLKQTILQLAVMGKLVPQNPNDEPASELLKKIAAEKTKLIADKKIKKSKPLPEITEDEKPFDLPDGWEWSRLPDLGELARGKSKHRPRNDPKLYIDGDIPLIQTGDVSSAKSTGGRIITYTAKYNQEGLEQSRLWSKGTLCITIAANIADSGIMSFDACFPDSVVGFTPFIEEMDVKYFDLFIRTAKADLETFAPSTAQKNINLQILSDLFVPLPPLNELNLIVSKVNELMTLCDQLKTQLQTAQQTQIHLAQSIAQETLK